MFIEVQDYLIDLKLIAYVKKSEVNRCNIYDEYNEKNKYEKIFCICVYLNNEHGYYLEIYFETENLRDECYDMIRSKLSSYNSK